MSNKLLIVSSHFNENMDWLINQQEYDFLIYSKNINVLSNYKCQEKFFECENKCFEVSSYLAYIIENYNNLPQFVAFIHGHEDSYHQDNKILDKLREIKYIGYETLNRRDWRNVFHDHVEFEYDNGAVLICNWNFVKANYVDLGLNLPIPQKLICTACGQFVVRKDLILSNSLNEYVKMREWMNTTTLEEHLAARVFEHLWNYIFTHNEVET